MKHISAKNLLAACVVSTVPIVLATDAVTAAPSSDCSSADPKKVLTSVGGDFEIKADPQDSAGNLIFIANAANGASSVVAVRLNATSGQAVAGTRTTIANNFVGQSAINGPEFVQKPSGALGVLYAGDGGVHAVFRGDIAGAWNDFRYNADATPTGGSPASLAATTDGNYPGFQLAGLYTYSFFQGSCTSRCAADFRFGTYTDFELVLNSLGLTGSGAAPSPRDGYGFLTACDANANCGIYEAQIDGAGGFASGTFQLLAPTATARKAMASVRHPLTGTTVLFTEASSSAIDVWEQPAAGGPLTLIAEVPSVNGSHYTALRGVDKVVLHYYGGGILKNGSYTLPVTASGTTLVAGTSKLVSSQDAGSELVWLPAVDKWALYYRSSNNTMMRCWITP